MKKIENISFTKLRHADFLQFHLTTLSFVKSHGATQVGIVPSLVTQYENQLTVLSDYVKRPLNSQYTQQIRLHEQKRNDLFRLCYYRLCLPEAHPNERVQKAAVQIKRELTDVYTLDIPKEAYMTATSHIRGFLVDVARLGEDVLKALGLDVLLPVLKTTNENFVQYYAARTAERAEVNDGVVNTQRNTILALYEQITLYIAYSANRVTTVIANEDERSAAEEVRDEAAMLVDELNENRDYFVRYYINKSANTADPDVLGDGDVASDDTTPPVATDTGTTAGNGSGGGSAATGNGKTPTDVVEVTEP